MNTKHLTIAAAVLLALAPPARSQVKYGGYLSFEYLKGQTESPYPHGNLENLLAGFLVAGQTKEKFGFVVEARTLGVSAFDLAQAWAGFLPSKTINIRVGLFLVPFGTWNRASRPHETLLIRTPLNLESLYPATWRDLGIVVEGETGVLSYAGYLGNGLAESDDASGFVQQFSDNNTDKAKGGRVGLVVGEAIRAGISYYTGKYDSQDMRDLTLEGADLSWVTSRWEVHGEYTKAMIENPQPFVNGKSEGFSIWMAMTFRGFQPIGSYQEVKSSDPYHGGGIALDRSRWSAGLRYVLGSTIFIKAEYDWNSEKGIVIKDNQFQVQLGLSF